VGGRIDLNADLGEGIGDDEALLAIVTSANIATGAHAGGGTILAHAVAAATRWGVAIGAHPSYRDRAGFGRASYLAVLRSDVGARAHVVADLVAQILAVAREADLNGATLTHVKAHGSLYNDAVRDPVAAQVVADAVLGAEHALGHRVAVMTQPGGDLAGIGAAHGLTVIAEGFADRAYQGTGQLVPRSEPGAVHADVDAMVAQALDLAGGHIDPIDGPRLVIAVDSLCVHGDTPGAVDAARAIRGALEEQGWQVVAPGRQTGGSVGSSQRAVPVGGSAHAADRSHSVAALEPLGPRDPSSADWSVQLRAFGDRAVLLEPGDGRPGTTSWVLRVAARVRQRWPEETVVPGLASVLVAFDRPSQRPDPRDVLDELSQLAWSHGSGPAAHREVVLDAEAARDVPGLHVETPGAHALPTRYVGPDLAEVAGMLGIPAAEVVRRHGEAIWTVAAIGFSPGFGYLTTTDPLFSAVVRRPDPRPRVPRGSVALAAQMCAVYPSATPGGWQLIGTTTAELFDIHAEHPALLRVGDLVEFIEVP
jgi:UPF0271 protein